MSRALLAVVAVLVGAVAHAPTARPAVPEPPILQRPIPFDAQRRADTAAYARRHYGLGTWRLVRPRVIVEHVTVTTSLAPVLATFARNAPDAELHELPGTCAHFVVDRDGTILQLVPLSTMCRHTVGLNWTAIGIEHVGTSAAQVLANPRQLRASLRLTAWLAGRYGIALADVIGHNESIRSPYHRERYASWRCQTHGDFTTAEMRPYRQAVARLAAGAGVPLRARSLPPPPPRCLSAR